MQSLTTADTNARIFGCDPNYQNQTRLILADKDNKIASIACEIIPKNGGLMSLFKFCVLSLFKNHWKATPTSDGSQIFINIKSAAKHSSITSEALIDSKNPIEDIQAAYRRNILSKYQNENTLIVNAAEDESEENGLSVKVKLGAEFQDRLAHLKDLNFPCAVAVSFSKAQVVVWAGHQNSLRKDDPFPENTTVIIACLHRHQTTGQLFLAVQPTDEIFAEKIAKITNPS